MVCTPTQRWFIVSAAVLSPLLQFGCTRSADNSFNAGALSDDKRQAASKQAPDPAGAKEQPKPSAVAPAAPPPPNEASKPATLDEIAKIIDLSKLPMMKDAEKVRAKPTEVQYSCKGKLADAADFYRKTMTGLGWTEDTEPIAGLDGEKYVFVKFLKGGFCVGVSAYTEEKAGTIGVHVANQGNVDARRLPRPADAKPVTFYRHFVTRTTAADPDAAANFCRKEFTALGWKDDPPDDVEFHKSNGRTLVHVVDNAMECLIAITAKEGKTSVEYMPGIWREGQQKARLAAAKSKGIPTPATVPQMKEAIDLSKFPILGDGKPTIATAIYLGYEAAGDVAKAVAFCREKLTAAGWTEDNDIQLVHEKNAMLVFSKGDFHVEVNIGREKSVEKVTVQLSNRGNVDARLLPQPADAKNHGAGMYSVVHYNTGADLVAAAEFCRTELKKLGWQDKAIPARKTGTYIILAFTQNAMKLDIEIQNDSKGKTSVAIRTGVVGRP